MLAFSSCVAVAVVSWHTLLTRSLPAWWVGVYGLGVVVAATGYTSGGARAYIESAMIIIAAAAISFGSVAVHRHVSMFLVAAHAICTLERLAYDNRVETLLAVAVIDILAFSVGVYSHFKARKKEA